MIPWSGPEAFYTFYTSIQERWLSLPLVEGDRATLALRALSPKVKLLVLHLLWDKRRD